MASAGCQLAAKVQAYCTKETLILGIANGGVPVAAVVARQLQVPLDIILIKRLLTPRGPQFPVCAINVAGTLVLDEDVPACNTMPVSPIDHYLSSAQRELSGREHECRAGKPAAVIQGKDIVLIDNGIHTGSTMKSAVRATRRLDPARIIAAAPLAAAESLASIEQATDGFVCLMSPENFGHVGLWYSDFDRPSDVQVREMFELL